MLRLGRRAHLADALLVALVQLVESLAEGVGEALLQVGAFGARLAGVLGQRLAQHVQALVGAGAELGQARAEAVDALRLRGRQRSEERREGKSVSVRVDLGGRRIIKKKTVHIAPPNKCTTYK